ncbi:unnamed protein product [Brassica rapa subsp. trilocularis]
MLGGSKAPPMAKQNATSGTLASREFYKESSQPSNALKKTTVALEQSLRDINGGRDINEIISEVDGEKFGKAFSFQLKLGDFNSLSSSSWGSSTSLPNTKPSLYHA